MKNLKTFYLFVNLVIIILIFSCSSMGKNEWKSLQDRNFYFQKFLLVKKGINDKKAFEIMKSLPVDKTLALLAHKYQITIDSSEYADLISSDTVPQYKNRGIVSLLMGNYSWESVEKNQNSIELHYYLPLDLNTMNETTKCKIVINIDGKEKETIYNEPYSTDSIIEYLAKDLDYSRLSPKSENIYVNNETKAQIDLTKAGVSVVAAQVKTQDNAVADKKKVLSEETIKQDIKQHVSKMTPGNRKKFRDSIIKFLYSEIE